MNVHVVIGAGGMGEAIARRGGTDRTIVLADINQDLLAAATDTLAGEGLTVERLHVDVTDAESMHALAEQAANLGPVVSAVHTAGLSPAQASTDAILRVDLVGVAHFLDAFGQVIAGGGAGVVIASMAGTMSAGRLPDTLESQLATTPTSALLNLPFLATITDPGTAYGIAKRANQLRVQAAALAWGTRGARVNSVSPGVISTPMGLQELAGESGAQMRAMIDAAPTRRIGTPDDIAAAVAFLTGPDASYITGTDLLVDGGAVAGVRAHMH
ncbi:NAD(P)-dependent dehydrogenase (short-subunit alcohol dehydrogenase family) [Pseudarthrobacter oxydans]|uniref:NAD(P)-dependent dehydrogenase (Short-subunit alcohol dehydrogenase family) n=1 Tax=Pseudarthrobacter oxydans TaxID=1671 RepID=A0AAW8NDR6_PSEOX|nr:SDR family oxidoreductase [Pseudarthrobacter oxydans]MDR7165733.1 NAD(P)-dependent dehydrogenase (short-subunit alcohol dehydrogenase family) [Pseudarthrobacter oxydans]